MRLFAAILFTPVMKNAFADCMRELRAAGVSGNYTREENLHLTIAFIGETPRVAEAERCIGKLDAHPFVLTAEGAGRFGNTLWAGIRRSAELLALADGVTAALRAAGFAIEQRRFTPHITLVREAAGVIPRFSPPHAEMTVGRVSLMKSERIGGRLVYTEIYAKELI